MLTVRDLLRDLDVRLLAGERGLHLPGEMGPHLRAARPDAVAVRWRAAADHRHAAGHAGQQREFAARLADHHLAGLGFGTGFKHAGCPAPLLEVAAEREFPVFEVPYEVPFIAVTEAAFTQLVNEQYAVLRRALAAQERLERIVLSERGLEALVGALATLIGAAVVVFDARGSRCSSTPSGGRSSPRRSSAQRGGARAGPAARGADVHALAGRRQPGAGAPGRRRRHAPAAGTVAVRAVRPRRGWWRSRTPGRCLTSTG